MTNDNRNDPPAVQVHYRPEIDGLRAIAVLAVVLFHVGFAPFSGGFVGVDIFLVISGYLISGILLREYDQTGTISLRSFYYRRLRRIAPALLVTLALTSVPLLWLYSPVLLEPYGRSLWMAVASISNIGFYTTSGYFGATSETKPLLHTWSLSVEEQFYLLWPLVLLAILRFSRYRFHFIALIGMTSLATAQYVLGRDPDAAFFLMPFRIFEFAIGALIHAPFFVSINLSARYSKMIAALGFVAIVSSIGLYSEATIFPGLNALLPCLGTAALLLCGQNSVARQLLNAEPIVWIGKISYSLYLVHWPLFLLYQRYRTIFLLDVTPYTLVEQGALIVGAFVFAFALHRLVEVPFRTGTFVPHRFVAAVSAVMLLCATVGIAIESQHGLPGRSWLPDSSFMASSYPNWLRARLQKHAHECILTRTQQCIFESTARRHALIIGNSHAIDGLNILATARSEDYFVLIDTNGCAATADEPVSPRCNDPKNLRFDPEFLRQFDYVVISRQVKKEHIDDNLDYLRMLADIGVRRVIVMSGYYRSSVFFDDALQMRGNDATALGRLVEDSHEIDGPLATASDTHGFLFIDKYALLCTGTTCPLFTPDGVPFTYDKHHLTRSFATYIGRLASNRINAYLTAP